MITSSTRVPVSVMFAGSEALCPVCQSNMVHIGKVAKFKRSDDPAGTRLQFWCESGHTWALEFLTHAGCTNGHIVDVAEVQVSTLINQGGTWAREPSSWCWMQEPPREWDDEIGSPESEGVEDA